MKRFFILLFLLSTILCTEAQTLTGGVKYSVDDARIELRQNIPEADFVLTSQHDIDINTDENQNALLKGITKLNDRTLGLFSDGTYAINYNSDPKHVYYYDKNGAIINIEIKTSTIYPYKTYKYTPYGELVNMTLRVTEKESYIFTPLGKLLGHWLNENCYDDSGKIIMTRKIIK